MCVGPLDVLHVFALCVGASCNSETICIQWRILYLLGYTSALFKSFSPGGGSNFGSEWYEYYFGDIICRINEKRGRGKITRPWTDAGEPTVHFEGQDRLSSELNAKPYERCID